MKILITGGHHTSALAVIEELRKQAPEAELIFVGHTHSMQSDKNVSAEYEDLKRLGIPFFDIKAGKFFGIKNPIKFFAVLRGFVNAFNLLIEQKPSIILSFGGYIAVPIVLSGYILKIPSVTHEQTVVTGLANKVISKFVKKIFISWESSRSSFAGKEVIFTGIPLRKELFKVNTKSFEFKNNLPVVCITGGKQGSHRLNEIVFSKLKEILSFCNLIHQCGSSSVFNDFENAKQLKSLTVTPEKLGGEYVPCDYIRSNEIGELFSKTTLMVGRSGAHFVSEFIALRKPSLLVPIPWVSHNEQYLNALVAKESGLAEILEEKDLTADSFVSAVKQMLNNLGKYKLVDEAKFPLKMDSAFLIANETLKTIHTN